jgi:hypothetical protein
MYSIAMDVGKYRTYGIVERDGEITKEGYMPTTKQVFQSFKEKISKHHYPAPEAGIFQTLEPHLECVFKVRIVER